MTDALDVPANYADAFDPLKEDERQVALWLASPKESRAEAQDIATAIGKTRQTVYRIAARPHVELAAAAARRSLLTVKHLPDLWADIFDNCAKDKNYALDVAKTLLKEGIHPFTPPTGGGEVGALPKLGAPGAYERVILERGKTT